MIMNIRDIGAPGRAEIGPAPGPAGRAGADRESVERLERALKAPKDQNKDKGKDHEREGQSKGAEREFSGALSGAAILRGLAGGSEAAGGLAAPAGPGDVEGRLEALSEIADRLLVSETGDKEIRISIKESVLPGAEVRLTLKEGSVGVSFVCQNEGSALFLERHKADLERRLAERLGGPADVQVDREASEGGDGRSRGRRDLYAEWADRKS